MRQVIKQAGLSLLVLGSAIALGSAVPVQAQLFDSPVDRLSAIERTTLRDGKPLVTGEKGHYVGRILVTTTPTVVWSVLTDYEHFPKFVPNVVSSKVLQTDGNRKVIEQVDVRNFLLIRVQSRVRSTITETVNQRIDFQRVEGDVPKLDGHWLIEPVAPYAGAKANQVLVTQVVTVQPSSRFGESTFYNIFKNAMTDSLNAIRREIDRRASSQNSAASSMPDNLTNAPK